MMRVWLCYFFLIPFQFVLAQSDQGEDAYSIGVDGIKLVDDGDYEEGIKLLKQARNLEPHDYDYAFELGKAYLNSGNPKKAEKYLFDLQYHKNAQADLYIALSNCYAELDESKKTQDSERKKELDALRYGIQKLPSSGILYLELGKKKLEMEESVDALAVFESGIQKAPNFAENYFWAAKLLNAAGNNVWAWFYAEICFNMTDDQDLLRSCALMVSNSSDIVFDSNLKVGTDKTAQNLKSILSEKCERVGNESGLQLEKRKCLLENWQFENSPASQLFERLKELEKRGLLESYLATILDEKDKEQFLKWLTKNAQSYEEYRTWRYWNPLQLKKPVNRITQY